MAYWWEDDIANARRECLTKRRRATRITKEEGTTVKTNSNQKKHIRRQTEYCETKKILESQTLAATMQ